MKIIPQALGLSSIPFLHPLTAIAAPDAPAENASSAAVKVDKVHAGSWRASKVIGANVKNAPDESIATWPVLNDAATTERIQAFHDSIEVDRRAPDNTAGNKDERKNSPADPTGQGGSGVDLETIRKVRSENVDADLSFTSRQRAKPIEPLFYLPGLAAGGQRQLK